MCRVGRAGRGVGLVATGKPTSAATSFCIAKKEILVLPAAVDTSYPRGAAHASQQKRLVAVPPPPPHPSQIPELIHTIMSGGFSETNLKKLYNLLDIDGSGFVGKDEFTVSLPLQIPAKRSLGADPFGWCR